MIMQELARTYPCPPRVFTPRRAAGYSGAWAFRDVVHVYHAWCDGPWQDIVAEHCAMLEGTGFFGTVYLSLSGQRDSRQAVADAFRERLGGMVKVGRDLDEGFEHAALDLAREVAGRHPGHAVLYAHTKGITHQGEQEGERIHMNEWRRCMTRAVLLDWRSKLAVLEDCDAIGEHLLTPQDFPGLVRSPFFGGNFWWANASFLRDCKLVDWSDRHTAETWLGDNGARMRAISSRAWPWHPHV
jgi:hypothetical protein